MPINRTRKRNFSTFALSETAINCVREYNADKGEKELSDTVANALRQIEDKRYDADLLARGIPTERIYKYGFAFRGSECLIGME